MSLQERIKISQIGQIMIPVQDIERAVAFYRDVLSLPFLFQVPNLAFFQCGEVRIMLSPPEGAGATTKASVIYYKVADLPATFETLRQNGVKLVDQPHIIAKMEDHDLWMAFVEDSEGNILGLMSEVHPS